MTPPPSSDTIATFWRRILAVDTLAETDNILAKGATSLHVLQFINWIEKHWHRRLPIRAVYMGPTISECAMAVAVLAPVSPDDSARTAYAAPNTVDFLQVLTGAQRHFHAEARRDPANPSLYVEASFHITGDVNLPALRQSFDIVGRRHEALHCYFVHEGAAVERRLDPDAQASIRCLNIDDTGAPRDISTLSARLAADLIEQTIDLSRAPLYRVVLAELGRREWLAVICAHHIILDGPGLHLWLKEVSDVYAEILATGSVRPALAAPQQSTYLAWLDAQLSSDVVVDAVDAFRQTMSGAETTISFAPVERTSGGPGLMHGSYRILLSENARAAVAGFAADHGCSHYAALITAWNIVIYRRLGIQDMTFRAAGSARDHAEFAQMIGMLWAPLYVRCQFSSDTTVGQLAGLAQASVIRSQAFLHMPFDTLVDALRPEIDMEKTPPNFHFTLHGNRLDRSLRLKGAEVSPLSFERIDHGADIKIHMNDGGDRLSGRLVYRADRLSESFVSELGREFCGVAARLRDWAQQPISACRRIYALA
ncbi:condensation domain-containing protein [Burkholderia glumae]|uniref:condensation domain-containing protein n=1 Tax=Burkholderia glumae TaxID=337 RepID=UPI00146473F8|nr:condensation domain-containing protein [Burkholderia glumae]QJP71581.1 hypothetical protein HJC54_15225 [Burkholderia glumae]UVS95796.1 hypothetical protein EFP19_08475 [Burkholderia glumae]